MAEIIGTQTIVKVTPVEFAKIQKILQQREVVFGSVSYSATVDALRSIGVEPKDGVTYRFEVVPAS